MYSEHSDEWRDAKGAARPPNCKVGDAFWDGFCPETHQIILDLVKRVEYRGKYRDYYAQRKELFELIKKNKNKKNISNDNIMLFYKTTWEGRRCFQVFIEEISKLSEQMEAYKPKEEKPADKYEIIAGRYLVRRLAPGAHEK